MSSVDYALCIAKYALDSDDIICDAYFYVPIVYLWSLYTFSRNVVQISQTLFKN